MTFSYGLLHMDTPVLADQQKTPSVLGRDWMLSRGATNSESQKESMQSALFDNDTMRIQWVHR